MYYIDEKNDSLKVPCITCLGILQDETQENVITKVCEILIIHIYISLYVFI